MTQLKVRELTTNSTRFTKVCALGAPDEKSNANNYYLIQKVIDNETVCALNFQDGPIADNGVNGIVMEDLLSIVIDRLNHFQSKGFACEENAQALTKLEEAMHCLNNRTKDRQTRGVEGKYTE